MNLRTKIVALAVAPLLIALVLVGLDDEATRTALRRLAALDYGDDGYSSSTSHMAFTHPDQTPMSYEAFFRERQQARYGSGKGRCC
jgi:uncharacterized short protein YbdD (DUF466 family)